LLLLLPQLQHVKKLGERGGGGVKKSRRSLLRPAPPKSILKALRLHLAMKEQLVFAQ
jgi:hypothetical protein